MLLFAYIFLKCLQERMANTCNDLYLTSRKLATFRFTKQVVRVSDTPPLCYFIENETDGPLYTKGLYTRLNVLPPESESLQ